MNYLAILSLAAVLFTSPLMAAENERVLFDFDGAESIKWKTPNSVVLGGQPAVRYKITTLGNSSGTLLLKAAGGFALLRSRPTNLCLEEGDTIITRVRGDGRRYFFNLHAASGTTASTYRAEFQTKKDEWIEVDLPLDSFVATALGQPAPDQPLDPKEVNSIGFLLAEDKAGPFKLEVDWIKVRSGSEDEAAK